MHRKLRVQLFWRLVDAVLRHQESKGAWVLAILGFISMVAAKLRLGFPPFIGGTEHAGRGGVCFGKGNHRYISRNQTSKILDRGYPSVFWAR